VGVETNGGDWVERMIGEGVDNRGDAVQLKDSVVIGEGVVETEGLLEMLGWEDFDEEREWDPLAVPHKLGFKEGEEVEDDERKEEGVGGGRSGLRVTPVPVAQRELSGTGAGTTRVRPNGRGGDRWGGRMGGGGGAIGWNCCQAAPTPTPPLLVPEWQAEGVVEEEVLGQRVGDIDE
jgi:hypothetical protein